MIDGQLVYFVTFADSSLKLTLQRIKAEAQRMNLFDGIFTYDETLLDDEFRNRNRQWFVQHRRGYGLWIWKPQVILQTLRQIPDNAVIVYADAGCTLNSEASERLKQYVRMVKQHPSHRLIFHSRFWREDQFTTEYVLQTMNFTGPAERGSRQCYATSFLLQKTDDNIELINKWSLLMQEDKRMVEGGQHLRQCYAGFKDHRHDQSILSILMKQSQSLILEDEISFDDRRHVAPNYPIQSTRLKY